MCRLQQVHLIQLRLFKILEMIQLTSVYKVPTLLTDLLQLSRPHSKSFQLQHLHTLHVLPVEQCQQQLLAITKLI